jgi:hypothetical protein
MTTSGSICWRAVDLIRGRVQRPILTSKFTRCSCSGMEPQMMRGVTVLLPSAEPGASTAAMVSNPNMALTADILHTTKLALIDGTVSLDLGQRRYRY